MVAAQKLTELKNALVLNIKKCQCQLAKRPQVFRVVFHRMYVRFQGTIQKRLNELNPAVLVQVGVLMVGVITVLYRTFPLLARIQSERKNRKQEK